MDKQMENWIGIDIDIEENIRSGYGIVDTENKSFNQEYEYNYMEFTPDFITGDLDIFDKLDYISINTYISWSELVNIYNDNKEDLNSFAEIDQHTNFTEPSFYDFVNLAFTINKYQGLP